MRLIAFLGFLLLWLTGCSKYQFVTMEADHVKTKRGTVEVDNDTFRLRYSFSGVQGPARVEIINKTSQTLYIRWRASSLTRRTWPINTIRPIITADSRSNTPMILQDNFNKSSFSQVEYPEEIIILEKGAFSTSKPISIREDFFRISTPWMKNGELNGDKMRFQYFGRQNTPMMFTGIVEWSTSADFTNANRITTNFWVDEVVVTMVKPQHVVEFKGRDDFFYLRKGSGFGVFLAAIGFFTYMATSHAGE